MIERAFEFLFVLALVAPAAAVIIGVFAAGVATPSRSWRRPHAPDHIARVRPGRSGHGDGGFSPVWGISRAARRIRRSQARADQALGRWHMCCAER